MIAFIAPILLLPSCRDTTKDYLDEYNTILYIKNSGVQQAVLYRTGFDNRYKVTVIKAGYLSSAKTSVTAVVMDAGSLAIYNDENNTNYTEIPSDCYSLGNMSLNFGSNDLYKHVEIMFKTDNIEALPAGFDYVLPLELVNSPDSINVRDKYVLLSPVVRTPTVFFEKPGNSINRVNPDATDAIEFKVPVTLIVDNEWDFTCTVDIDEEALEEYNDSGSGAVYKLLPERCYSINQVAQFVPGNNIANIEIIIDRSEMTYGQFAIPLRLVDCSNTAFDIDDTRDLVLLGISYIAAGDPITLTADMVSTNHPDSQYNIANTVDGNDGTFWQSLWNASGGQAFFQVELDDVYSYCYFEMNGYNNPDKGFEGSPTSARISTSMNGSNWSVAITTSDNLPMTDESPVWKSPIISPVSGQMRYLRIETLGTPSGYNFIAMSEFKMWGKLKE